MPHDIIFKAIGIVAHPYFHACTSFMYDAYAWKKGDENWKSLSIIGWLTHLVNYARGYGIQNI